MGAARGDWQQRGRRVLRYARSALARMLATKSGESVLPDYSDAALIAALSMPSGVSPIREAPAGSMDGAQGHVRRQVVNHFDRRTHPRFFFDPVDAPALASAIEKVSSGWEDRLGRWTTATMTEALTVYDRPAAPLRPGFPWAGHSFAALDDVLFAARPHRFAFAPMAACATLVGRLPAGALRELLSDWCRFAAADGSRIAFVSNLVVSQRLVACSWAYALLGATADAAPLELIELKWQLLKIIAQDVAYLRPRLGTSYPNNHLLVDRFAAWYIAALYPELDRDETKLPEAEMLWLRECEAQTYPDGGYFEPSVHYHALAAELLSGYVLLARRQKRPLAEWAGRRLEAMLRFQAYLSGADGQPPAIGDATEDSMFPLTIEHRSPQALRALYRMLFAGGTSGATESDPGREWAFWMLGGQLPGPEGARPAAPFAPFPDTGVFVFSEERESTRLVLRTAPSPERRVMSGHMHSDLMSFYLVQSGTPLVVDSGTFTYRFVRGTVQRGTANWRPYLTGASAHNTVLIGGQDLLDPLEGDFRPESRVPRSMNLGYRTSGRLAYATGRLDGPPPYAGLARGVVHVCNEYFLIWTMVPPVDPPQTVRFALQLAPGTGVETRPGALTLTGPGVSVALVASAPLVLEAIRAGSHDPVAGWVSRGYGALAPAPQLAFGASTTTRLSALLFRPSDRAPVSSVACEIVAEDMGSIQIAGAGFSDRLLVNVGPGAGRRVSLRELTFDGDVLWARQTTHGAVEIRALAARVLKLPEHGVALSAGAEPEDLEYSSGQHARDSGSATPADGSPRAD